MKLVIANFKSNKNESEYSDWLKDYQTYLPRLSPNIQVVLAPSFPVLASFAPQLGSLHSTQTFLGVQDLSSFPAGAYTGAVSAHNLEGLSVRFAILGHSERRRYFHETSTEIANKVSESVANGITPILCVTADQVEAQANALDQNLRSQVFVAFEPIEHIGTGIADTDEHIAQTRERVRKAFGNVPYIYGGSVNPDTESEILNDPQIDGFLVGTACLKSSTFTSLLSNIR